MNYTKICALFSFILLTSSVLHAANIRPNTDILTAADWNTASNWVGGAVPTATDDVRTNGFDIIIAQDITVNKFSVNSGSDSVAVLSPFTLTTTTDLEVSGTDAVFRLMDGAAVDVGGTFESTARSRVTFESNTDIDVGVDLSLGGVGSVIDIQSGSDIDVVGKLEFPHAVTATIDGDILADDFEITSASGIYNIGTTAVINITGDFLLNQSNNELNIAGLLNIESWTFQGNSAHILNILPTGDVNVSGDVNLENGADITVDGSLDIVGALNITLNTSQLSGSGSLSFGSSSCPMGCDDNIMGGLPVELASFSAYRTNEGVKLEWTTLSETNNDYFSIERSVRGGQFEVIAKMIGAGNSTEEIAYDFTDQTDFTDQVYYRLKQTDFDGQYSYSPAILPKGRINNAFQISVFPSRVKSNQTITVRSLKEETLNGELVIVDLRGRAVFVKSLNDQELLISRTEIGVPNGVYHYRIASSGTHFQGSLVYD